MQTTHFLDSLFVQVRDIPFGIVFQPKDEITQVEHAIKRNKAGCTAKHCLLGRVLRGLGFNVSYLDFPFYWQDQANLPQYLRDIAIGLPLSHHLSLEVVTNNGKQFIDATWDRGLLIGFKVNDPPFSAGSQCVNAVTPHDEPDRFEDLQRRKSVKNWRQYLPQTDEKLEFYTALNSYLAYIRALPALL